MGSHPFQIACAAPGDENLSRNSHYRSATLHILNHSRVRANRRPGTDLQVWQDGGVRAQIDSFAQIHPRINHRPRSDDTTSTHMAPMTHRGTCEDYTPRLDTSRCTEGDVLVNGNIALELNSRHIDARVN